MSFHWMVCCVPISRLSIRDKTKKEEQIQDSVSSARGNTQERTSRLVDSGSSSLSDLSLVIYI